MRPDFDRDELFELAALVANDFPLAGLTLGGDGVFQTRDINFGAASEQVADAIRSSLARTDPDTLPHLFYACGRARGGSTSLTNVFGMAGIPSYYQPVKSALRHVLNQTNEVRWELDVSQRYLMAKETFGPYTVAESLYQPVDILIAAGYPAAKIDLIVFDRAPESALASWLAKWSHRLPVERLVNHFVLAGLNTQRAVRRAASCGVRTTTYVYEICDKPTFAIERLFARLGIPSLYVPDCVSNWQERGELSSMHSAIIFPDEPQIFDVPGLHGSDSAYRFHKRAACQLPDSCASLIEDLHVEEDYRASVSACAVDLGVPAEHMRTLVSFAREACMH